MFCFRLNFVCVTVVMSIIRSSTSMSGISQQIVPTSNAVSKSSARSYAQIAGNGNKGRARSHLPMNTYERII